MKKTTILFVAIITFVISLLLIYITPEASTTGVLGVNWQTGKVTADHTGWLRINGDTYYIHKTKSVKYDTGEACRNEYRWRDGKLYYFKNDGRVQKHDSHYIKLNPDDSVCSIYIAGSNYKLRYNVKRRRYQQRINGTWHDIGMQTNIWWMCDMQE